MNFGPEDRKILDRLLVWRRDIRSFCDHPLDEALIDRLHLAMDLAPSVGNSRPWRVIRIESAALRGEVRDEFTRCNAEAAFDYQGERQRAYRDLLLAGLDSAPLQLAVFTLNDPDEGLGLGRRTIPQTLAQSTSMAIFTLWLAARAENVGLGMVSILDPQRIEQLCAVPDDWRFSAYLCLGYPRIADDDTPLLHRVGWQVNTALAWGRR